MPASTTRPRRISTRRCARPAPTASTSISTMSAARSPTPCCATSTSSAASRCAARSRSTTPPRPPMGPRLLGTFVGKRVRAQGFIVTDFAGSYEPAMRQMGEWIKSGQAQVSRGRRAGHRQGAARLHRPAARRELRQAAGEDVDELRRALRRPEGRRSQPGHRRTLLRHAARPARRRRDQGRGHRRRRLGAHAGHALRQPLGLIRSSAISASAASRSISRARPASRCVWRLLKGADVFLEGFRPGVIKRLGFDYEAVSAREPRILYLSISGFGQTGPLAERPAMDPVLQAYTGLMSENRGEDGIPHRVPVIVVDMSTGALCLPGAVGRALCPPRRDARPLHRRQPDAGGDGAAVDPPDGLPSRGRHDEARRRAGRRVPDRRRLDVDPGHQRPRLAEPVRGDGDAGAGRRSALRHAGSCGSPTTWRSTPSCGRRSRRGRRPMWSERLTEARLMHERLNSYADFLDQPHVRETGLIQWLTQAGLNQPVPVPALPGMLPQLDGTPRGDGAGHRPAHRRDPAPSTATARPRSTALLAQGRRRRRHDHASRSRRSIAARRGRTAAASTRRHRVERRRCLALRPHADHGARALLRLHGLRPGAGAGRPAAAWCWRRPTARSTCARPSSRCASPARRRS